MEKNCNYRLLIRYIISWIVFDISILSLMDKNRVFLSYLKISVLNNKINSFY